jgi:hypothetical protein
LPYALVQNSLLSTNDHKHKRNKKIGKSNGLTKHNEKEKMIKKKREKSSNEMFNSNVDG